VAGVTADLFGLNAYTTLPALHSLLGEAEGVSAALVSVDPALDHELEGRLKSLPVVARVERRRTAIERFHTQTGQTLWISSTILTVFGAIVALGVVYNAARVALSVRGRDLATLRVLGFTRGEIAFVLMAELVVYLALAVLPGVGIGVWFMHVAMGNDMAEVFRMPIAFSGLTYAFAFAVTAVAAAGSGLLLRRRLQRLDLLGVLEARE
jgi:putative ABC transport system permease protein